jgi:hypothetical protein
MAARIAALMSAEEALGVSGLVTSDRAGEVLLMVRVYDPAMAEAGTVRVGEEKVAAGVEIAAQLVPSAAAAAPGVPTETLIVEVGKATDSIGKAAELVRRTR